MTKADEYLWNVRWYLMRKYGTTEAYRISEPLAYYVLTGRASASFLNKMYDFKPYVMGRFLKKIYDQVGHTLDDDVADLKKKSFGEREIIVDKPLNKWYSIGEVKSG